MILVLENEQPTIVMHHIIVWWKNLHRSLPEAQEGSHKENEISKISKHFKHPYRMFDYEGLSKIRRCALLQQPLSEVY